MCVAVLLLGCGAVAGGKGKGADGEAKLFTVDFQQGRTLKYKFVSARDVEVNWAPKAATAAAGKSTVGKSTESLEMVVSYTPREVDPYGLSAIEVRCESIKAVRSKGTPGRASGRDAVESIAGEVFVITVDPAGRIEDYSQLDGLIRRTGQKAFRPKTDRGRIKEPDMIGDFVASQWFLWDSVASIEKPSAGVKVGQSWASRLSVPVPMVMRKARDVTYSLAEVRPGPEGELAVIRSSYALAESAPKDWPVPYTGRFQMAGMFGFFRGYKVLSLKGHGEEIFNIDAGRIERYEQQYTMRMEAGMLLPLGDNPLITIDQKLTMERIE